MIDGLLWDIRSAWRHTIRRRGFSVTAMLLLALGIGATVTIFTLINAVFLQPPPAVADPDRLVSIYTSDFSGPRFGTSSYPDYVDFAAADSRLAGIAAYSPRPFTLSTGRESFRTFGEMVTANYFTLLGVAPAIGRGLDTDAPASPRVVLGYALWRDRFAAAPDVLGRAVRLSGRTYTVVGVAPEGFAGSLHGVRSEVWLPIETAAYLTPGADDLTNRGDRNLFLTGRLADGATAAEARARLETVAGALHATYPGQWTDRTGAARAVTVLPEREARIAPQIKGPVSAFLAVLFGVSALVLVVCCANVANLLLSRAVARRREIATRIALGGGRGRVIRQLLLEGAMLAVGGGTIGLLLASWAAGALTRLRPPLPIPVSLDLRLDVRVVAFALAATAVTTLAGALAPALRATRFERGSALRLDAGGLPGGGRGLRNGLVVAQMAVSLVVLSAAGLFLSSLRHATRIDPGFESSHVALLPVGLGVQGYDESKGRRFYADLEARVRALPEVESAALGEIVPLGLTGQRRGISVEGYEPAPGEDMEFGTSAVGAGYFHVLRIPVLRGRALDDRDRADAPPVAVINEAFARRFWPGADPIGRRFSTGRGGAREVVGVVRDAKYRSLGEAPQPYFYQPFLQAYEPDMVLHVRTRGAPGAVLPALSRTMRALDPDLPAEPVTLTGHLGLSVLPQRLGAAVLGAFGAISIALTTLGLFGVVSYAVSQRSTEIGIRLAVGASGGQIIGLVVRNGMVLALTGCAIGAVGAVVASRLLGSFLIGVRPSDPLTLCAAVALLFGAALLASWVPARRAAALDPMLVLRSE